ncbi:MAG: rRNA maturation RNase YbeY [Alphaproteobacteria bacterium]|nr:rRNA maturation RNase YbeY [Alphaproteobacteria bacterium]
MKQVNKYKSDSKEVIVLVLKYLSENNENFRFCISKEIFLDLYLVDDKKITEINFKYRNKKEPTNVLSLAYFSAEDFNKDFTAPIHLGEIFISMETLAKESLEQKVLIEHHYFRLLIHGVLHLLGFDHNLENEAVLMYNTEENILHKLELSTNSIVSNYWR